jgi:hypothetical protein
VNGTNILAVEIHQFNPTSADLSFDLELAVLTENPQALRPQLKLQRAATDLVLQWPAGFNDWSLFRAGTLPVGPWFEITTGLTSTNGLKTTQIQATNQAGFYQLRRFGFCAPRVYP